MSLPEGQLSIPLPANVIVWMTQKNADFKICGGKYFNLGSEIFQCDASEGECKKGLDSNTGFWTAESAAQPIYEIVFKEVRRV